MIAKLLTLVLLLGLTATARAEADPPALVADPPRLEQRVNDLERRVAELERLLASKSVPTVPVYTAPPTSRPATGHTHTCANGHTWDHSVTTGHDCPVSGCGLSQYYQDGYSKPVNTTGGSYQSAPLSYSLSSGGCANGSCSSGSSGVQFRPFGGAFRRR